MGILDDLILAKINSEVQAALADDAVVDAAELAAAVQAALAADAIVDQQELTAAIQAALDADAEADAIVVAALNVIISARNAEIASLNATILTRDARIAELEAMLPYLPPAGPPVPKEMIVKAFYQETVPEGAVGSWQSVGIKPKLAEQTDPALQPTRLPGNGGVFFAKGTKQALKFSSDSDANNLHRWCIAIAKCPASTIPSGNSSGVFCVNGIIGGNGHRQPRIAFGVGTILYQMQGNSGVLSAGAPPSPPDVWNVIVGWRRGRTMQAAVNGVKTAETAITPLAPNSDSLSSLIGCDSSTVNLPADVTIDSIILGQSEIDDATIDKLVGWGMWRVGRQADLPVGHPYHDAAPTEISEPPRYAFDQARWDAWVAANPEAVRYAHRGEPAPAIVGYTTVFEDDFATASVVDDLTGAADSKWFAPTHLGNVGVDAVAQKVNSVPPCYIHDAANHTMTLRLLNSGGQWRTGAFSSVDKNGYGRSWSKGIFEIRCKFPALPSPRPGFFPAFWSYGREHLFWRTRNRLESDFFEYDGLNGAFINSNQHVHKPTLAFAHPDIRSSDVSKKVAGYPLDPAHGFPATIDIYDGQLHTWYWQIEDDFTYIVLDGLEVARFATSEEVAADKYIMVDWAYRASERAADPTQVYDMTIDYIRVRQKT